MAPSGIATPGRRPGRSALRPGRDHSPAESAIDLRLDPGTDNEAFTVAIKPLRQIIDAAQLTRPFDYLVHAQVSDTAALDGLIKQLKAALRRCPDPDPDQGGAASVRTGLRR